MSDPFANLLSNFKNSSKESSVGPCESNINNGNNNMNNINNMKKDNNRNNNSININGNSLNDLPFSKSNSSVSLTPGLSSVLQPTRKAATTPTPVRTPISTPVGGSITQNGGQNNSVVNNSNDDWDDFFGSGGNVLAQEKRSSTTSFDVSGKKDMAVQKKVETREEIVVDEVKDMEIARIMSLGVSFEKAVSYYDRGYTYEILEERRRRARVSNYNSNNTNTKSTSTPGDLFSIANSFISKSKQFINESLQFDENRYEGKGFSSFERNEANTFKTDRLSALKQNFGEYNGSKDTGDVFDNPFENTEVEEKDRKYDSVTKSTYSVSENRTNNIEQNLLDLDLDSNSSKSFSSTTQVVSTQNDNSLLDVSTDNSSLPLGNNTQPSLLNHAPSTKSVQMSQLEHSSYMDFKSKGHRLSQEGNFSAALENYEKALYSLPERHPLRVIALSNIISTLFKIGEFSRALDEINTALSLFPEDMGTVISNDENNKKFKDIWWKVVLRKAEILEQQEKYEQSLESYKSLVQAGFTNKKIIDGKQRCDKIVNPIVYKKTPVASTTQKSNSPSPSPSVLKIKRESAREKLEDEKFKLHDTVQHQIAGWTGGNESDLRYLLANLHKVLKIGNWKPVNAQDLIVPKKCKIAYLKAISKTHPDKINTEIVSLENQMLASNIFMILTKAWESFKVENNLA